jgi:hypothetical protein
MKVEIRDRSAFQALSHLDVRAYLAAQSWEEVGRIGNKATVHLKRDAQSRQWEILLPSRENVGDYAERMADALRTISSVEDRSELAVFRDLLCAGADVLRVAAPHGDAAGTIDIRNGVILHEQAENLLMSAACAAANPRPTYHVRKVTEAVEYIETVRLGQPEQGSYVITLLSPVTPSLRRESQPSVFDDEPFARQVTLKLATAWDALQEAVTEAAASDDFSAFSSRVQRGVNANFCESVALLARHCGGVRFSMSWATVRPASVPNAQRFFSADAARLIEEAAREFRRQEPRFGYSFTCFVVKLDREPEQFDGRAVLRIMLDERPRRVRAIFDTTEYNTVIQAFQDRTALSLDGDLFPVGQRYELRNPRNLRVEPDIEDDGPSVQSDDPLAS